MVDRQIATFYRERYADLVVFLMWHGASAADAAEGAQEAMAQVCAHWETVRHPYAWCRRVASRDWTRRAAERARLAGDAVGTAAEPATGGGLDEFEQRHLLLVMMRRHLTPAQQQVMAWTYDDVPPAAIAEALDLVPETVRSRLRDARRVLRAVWDHDEEGHR